MTRDPFATGGLPLDMDLTGGPIESQVIDPFATSPLATIQDETHVWHPDGGRASVIANLDGATLRLFIPGHPVTKGSMRVVSTRGRRPIMREDNSDSKPWRRALVAHLRRGGVAGRVVIAGPVCVALTFHVQQKVTRTGTTWPSHDVPHPASHDTGDIDKYARNVLDALQPAKDPKDGAGVIKDDSQVVELVARKTWAAESINGAPRVGVEIELRELQ